MEARTEIPEHAAKWKWLYAEYPDLQHADELLDRIVTRRKSPLFVDLEGIRWRSCRSFAKSRTKTASSRDTQFSLHEKGVHSLGIMMWRRRDGFGSLGDRDTLAKVQAVVQKVNPSSFHPNLRVLYTGHIAMAVSEQKTIQENITIATLICVGLCSHRSTSISGASGSWW